jgi:lipid-A-disaccharide synthase
MKLYLIAGEDSGDLHGANLVAALRRPQPDLHVRGVGGDQLIAQGMETVAHVRDINFMGFWEVLSHLGTIRRLFRTVRADVMAWKPDAVVLIDYPGFNLRLAPFIKGLGLPLYYYISPQIWAWKKGRIKQIRRYVDRMLVILPFELAFYRAEGVDVSFVGHPLLDAIDQTDHEASETPTIALLPGSRKQEISRLLPTMLALIEQFPTHRFVVAGAPSQSPSFYQALMGDSRAELVMNQTYRVLRQADFAVVASGTATLETALHAVPEIVVYRGTNFSYQIARRLIRVPYISLVNLILQKPAVPELIQHDCTPQQVGDTLRALMQPDRHAAMQADYAALKQALGEAGASQRAAAVILDQWAQAQNQSSSIPS